MNLSMMMAVLLFGGIDIAKGQCTGDAITGCLGTFAQDAGLGLDAYGIPQIFQKAFTEEGMAELCNTKDTLKTCMDPFISVCVPSIRNSLNGVNDVFASICENKQDFVTNSTCLSKLETLSFEVMCQASLNLNLNNDNWCEKTTDLFSCARAGTSHFCSDSTADYQQSMLSILYKNQADSYNCEPKAGQYRCTNEAQLACLTYFANQAGLHLDKYGIRIFSLNQTTETICSAFNDRFKVCSGFDTHCADINIQKTLDGIDDAFSNICGSGKSEYESSVTCLGKAENVESTNKCIDSLNTGLNVENYCSKTGKFYECLEESGEDHCSSSDSSQQRKMYQLLYAKQSERYECDTGSGSKTFAQQTVLHGCLLLIALLHILR